MSDAVVRPGWWFTTTRSLVLSACEYHARFLSRGPVLGVGRSHRTRGRSRTQKVQPPRKGAVITHLPNWIYPTASSLADGGEPRSETEDYLYEVAPRAQKALDLLGRLAGAAAGTGRQTLERAADAYWWVRRPDSVSFADVFRRHTPFVAAQDEFDRVTALLAEAKAGDASQRTVAAYEAERAQLRRRLALLRRKVEEKPSGDDELGRFCMGSAEKAAVQELAGRFVEEYGPLVLDFGLWCHETGYGSFARRDPALEGYYTTPLRFLGNERYMWPRRWRRWAIGASLEALERGEPAAAVAPPVGFYVWAAYMLTALREHPEWPGCRLFIANRLASLRLVSDEDWYPALVKHYPSREGRRLAARLHGELLDYLALGAAYRAGPRSIAMTVLCARCRTPFPANDGRRRYCDSCSKPRIRRAVRAKRHRERNRGTAPVTTQ